MGLRRDRESKAADAARRSAKAPTTRPSPPVSSCRKCSKIAAVRRELAKARREIALHEEIERGRAAAALAGEPIVLSEAQVEEAIKRAYHPALEDALRVPVDIVRSGMAPASDRLKASEVIVQRVAGKVPDKLQHSGGLTLTATIGQIDVFVHPSVPLEPRP